MRTLTILTALVLATTTLAFVPTTEAVGICSTYKDDNCDGYALCVGYRWSQSDGFECTGTGVRDPFQPCHCPPYEPTWPLMTIEVLP